MRTSLKLAAAGILLGVGLAGCVAYPVGPDTYTYVPAPAPYYAPTASFYYYDGPRYYGPGRYYGPRYYAPGRYRSPHYFGGGPRHYGHGPRHYDGHRR